MKQSYYFLGIGGIGMSALAHILIEKGVFVSGSDLKKTPQLQKKGVKLSSEISSDSTVVYSSAIKEDNLAFMSAKQRKIPIIHRSDLLKKLFEKKIALLVTGTHGKTSTSALLSWVLYSAGLEPTYAVGGILKNLNKNGGFGSGPFFIAEADESDGSFLNYYGNGAIITNIEKDHLDYWKTEGKMIQGFKTFIDQIKDSNLLFWCSDDPILQKLKPPGISYGKKGALRLNSCRQEGLKMTFNAMYKGLDYNEIILPLISEENVMNALAVFGMALNLGIPEHKIRKAFITYQGVKRRFEKIGEKNQIIIYDDYAHHPTEIRAILKSLKEAYPKRRIIVLFQPHRYSRSKDLNFCGAFLKADLVIITDIFGAGEKPIKGLNGSLFCKKLKGDNTMYLPKNQLLSILLKLLIPGDVFITVGAGDINEWGHKVLQKL